MRTSTGSIQRPMVLIALVILTALLGASAIGIGLYFIVVDMSRPPGPMGGLLALLGGMVLVPGVFELMLAYGLWKLRMWSWWLSVIAHGLVAVLVATILLFTAERSALYVLITVWLLAIEACLFTPQVRQAFRLHRQSISV